MSINFVKSISAFGTFSTSEIDNILKRLQVVQLKQYDFLLSKGEVCSALYFLKSGTLRHYHLDQQGNELIRNLFVQGNWVVDHSSFLSQKPSQNEIRAYETSSLLKLALRDLHELIEISPSFFTLGRILEGGRKAPNEYLKISPAERYAQLIENRPELLLRFPLKDIASYLAMTPETLSRARRNLTRKPPIT